MSADPESAGKLSEPVVLVLAPLAGDARAIGDVLTRAGLSHKLCRNDGELRDHLLPDSDDILFVVATHEAGTASVGEILLEVESRQAGWSRLPIVFLVQNVQNPPPGCRAMAEAVGQPPLVLLDRPVKPQTLRSVFDMQRRTRQRQFENRDLQKQLRDAEEYKDFLLRELRHRTGNSLGVLQSLFRLTVRRHTDVQALARDFDNRLNAVVTAYQRLVPGQQSQTNLETVFREHLAPYANLSEQIVLEGPDVTINERLNFDLSLVINELATNATKYGALSVPGGHIGVHWQLDEQTGDLDIVWQEQGGPEVSEPSREGLGSKLIEQFGTGGGAKTYVHYLPEGVRWTSHVPRQGYAPKPQPGDEGY